MCAKHGGVRGWRASSVVGKNQDSETRLINSFLPDKQTAAADIEQPGRGSGNCSHPNVHVIEWYRHTHRSMYSKCLQRNSPFYTLHRWAVHTQGRLIKTNNTQKGLGVCSGETPPTQPTRILRSSLTLPRSCLRLSSRPSPRALPPAQR